MKIFCDFMRIHCNVSILPFYLGRLKGMNILNYHAVAIEINWILCILENLVEKLLTKTEMAIISTTYIV